MNELYYRDLRKRVEKMEDKWLWAYPRIFGWVDSKGAVTILHENPQVAIYRKEEELHAAEMARLEAELDAIDATRAQTAAEPKPAQQMSGAREQAVVTPAPDATKPSTQSRRQAAVTPISPTPPNKPNQPQQPDFTMPERITPLTPTIPFPTRAPANPAPTTPAPKTRERPAASAALSSKPPSSIDPFESGAPIQPVTPLVSTSVTR